MAQPKKQKKIRLNQKGQGLIEYLVIVALMAIAAMSIMRVLSQTVQAKFANITQVMQGKNATSTQIQTEAVQERHFKKRDMGDFFHGAQSRGRGDNE